MSELFFLNNIAPVSHKSSVFVLRVNVVEDRELWSEEEHKVSQFGVREEVAEQKLLFKDHFFSPVGVYKSGV